MRRSGVAFALLLASACAASACAANNGAPSNGAPAPGPVRSAPHHPAVEANPIESAPIESAPIESAEPLAPEHHAEMVDVAPEPRQGADEPPVAELTDTELAQRVEEDVASLPCMSVGKPNAGALVNGVQMPEGPHWELIDPARAYATQETIDYLVTAIEAVEDEHGHLHPLWLGHFSDHDGGRLRPHRSHQSGRDVDLSYYYLPEKAEWYRPAVDGTLDVERTWTFVRALLTETDVELILIDRRVQKMLAEHALAVGEDPAWLDEVFEYRSRNPKPIIKHTWGHRTHIHVRFYNPKAQRLGHRAYDALADSRFIRPRFYTVSYRARAGDTVAGLAAKAGTSPEAFAKINGSHRVEVGRVYAVPMRGEVVRTHELETPARREPPPPSGARTRGVAAGEM